MPKPRPTVPPGPPGSLAAALATVPDPRHPNDWRPDRVPLPLVGLWQVAVAAMLCGARSLYAVAQWGRERIAEDPTALVPLGVPPDRSPSVATLHRVCKGLDAPAFERALGDWLLASGVDPADARALDGKTLRGIQGETVPGVHLVAADAHRAQAVVGQSRTAGTGHELAAAAARWATLPRRGRLITGDALLTRRAICDQIVAGGAATRCGRSTRTNRRCWRRSPPRFPPWTAPDADGLTPPTAEPWLVAELAGLGGGLTAVTDLVLRFTISCWDKRRAFA